MKIDIIGLNCDFKIIFFLITFFWNSSNFNKCPQSKQASKFIAIKWLFIYWWYLSLRSVLVSRMTFVAKKLHCLKRTCSTCNVTLLHSVDVKAYTLCEYIHSGLAVLDIDRWFFVPSSKCLQWVFSCSVTVFKTVIVVRNNKSTHILESHASKPWNAQIPFITVVLKLNWNFRPAINYILRK